MLYILQLSFYIVIHFAVGRLGLFLNSLSSGQYVYFWPAAGVAFVVLLLYGYRFLPGIFLGSLLVSLSSQAQFPIPIIAASASTISAYVAVFILKHFIQFQKTIERTRDMVGMTFVALPSGAAALATILSVGFWVSGFLSIEAVPFTWGSMFVSNFLSNVIIGVFLLVWLTNPTIKVSNFRRVLESIALGITLGILGLLMFTNLIDKTTSISYFVFIPLVWAALRFGLRETVTVLFLFSVLAVWSTLLGYGPLTTPNLGAVLLYLNLNAELLYLQGFMSVVSVTSMILATVVAERKELEKRKDNFISMASHELKTPLTSLKMRSQLMKKTQADKQSKKDLEQFEDMDRQIDKLTYLINDMLDLSKIQVGKLQLRKELFSLQRLVVEIAKSIQETESSHKIVIVGRVPHKVYADRDRIGQVIINLLSNAIKYSPKSDKIIVGLSASDTSVTISVKDFGIGIPKNRIPHIFDRFYQAHDYKSTFSGFGLGLFISSEIVKQHKGKIWVECEEGKGSTFFVTIPLA